MEMGTALLYMVCLSFGAMITPGVGISGHLFASVPSPLTNFSHLPAYGLLTWLLASGLRRREWPQAVAVGVAAQAALVFGVWMEILQGFVPGRSVDVGDVLMNATGIAIVSLLIGCEVLPIGGSRSVIRIPTRSNRGYNA